MYTVYSLHQVIIFLCLSWNIICILSSNIHKTWWNNNTGKDSNFYLVEKRDAVFVFFYMSQ